jgi:hypothetical protein
MKKDFFSTSIIPHLPFTGLKYMPTNTNTIGPPSAQRAKKEGTSILFNIPIDPIKKRRCMEGFNRTITTLNSGCIPRLCPCLL